MWVIRSARPLYLAAPLLFLALWSQGATAQLLGPEFQVNSYTTGHQYRPAVAADGPGNFVVVWQSYSDGSFWGVFGQRFNSAGSPAGSEFRVNSYTTSYQSDPAVAADSLGNFVVVWRSGYGQDGSGWGVFGQRYNAAGIPAGSEFRVNSYTTGHQRSPAVAADGSGNFVVVWESYLQDGSGTGVFGQRFNSAGSPAGSEFRVNSYTTSSQYAPSVAADGSGNFIVAWSGYGQDNSSRGVSGQRFDSVGTPVGGEFRVNTYTTGPQQLPAIAADGSGNFVIVWDSAVQDSSTQGVFGQRFNSVGTPLGSEFQINSYTTNSQNHPTVAADGSGNFVVVWQSFLQDGSHWGVSGQRFNSEGTALGGEFQVNAFTTSYQFQAAVTADGSGNFEVAWASDGQEGSNTGVLGRRMTVSIFSGGFELGDACAWSVVVGGGC